MMRWLCAIMLLLLVGGCSTTEKSAADDVALPPWSVASVTGRIVEPGDDPAGLCPASARLYVRVDGLKQWRANAEADPLVEYVNQVLLSVQPPGLWRQAGLRLGLDTAGVLDTYFGRTVAVIEQEVDDRRAVVVMSKASPRMLRKLPAAVDAEPMDAPRRVGPFALYRLRERDQPYTMAVGERWVMLTEARDAEHLLTLLTAVAVGEAPLRDFDPYQNMLARLPDPERRSVVLFSRNHRNTELHALTVTEHGPAETVDYVARIPRLDQYTLPPTTLPDEPAASLAAADSAPAPAASFGRVDFGPLPNRTIAAATINVLEGSLDRLARKQSRGFGLVEGLKPPVVLFIGSVPGAEVTPDPGIEVPVLGFALPAEDPELARRLDSLVRMVHLVLSLGELNPLQGMFGVRTLNHAGVTYHEADFGRAIARRFDDHELGRLANLPDAAGLTRLSFGRVGDWYIVCSQRTFFDRCIDAAADPARRLTAAADFAEFGFAERPGLLASALTRAPQLAKLVEGVAEFYRRAQLDRDNLIAARVDPAPNRLDLDSPLRYLAGALKHRRSFSVQMWTDPAGPPTKPLLRARMHIAAKE